MQFEEFRIGRLHDVGKRLRERTRVVKRKGLLCFVRPRSLFIDQLDESCRVNDVAFILRRETELFQHFGIKRSRKRLTEMIQYLDQSSSPRHIWTLVSHGLPPNTSVLSSKHL